MLCNLTQYMSASNVISVRQTRVLPPTSFRFHLAMDTLVLSYVLGTINPHSGLSPVRLRPCWAHTQRRILSIDRMRLCITLLLSLIYHRIYIIVTPIWHIAKIALKINAGIFFKIIAVPIKYMHGKAASKRIVSDDALPLK